MARFGNTSASSLLSAAQAGQKRELAYNDTEQSYIFELSAKTAEDYAAYEKYLRGRIERESDPSRALSLQKTITSAYRSYNSAEISRQSLAVAYGDQDKHQKYNNMFGLYQQAISNGDYSLAQSIESQLASLSVQIQNEADASAAAGRAAASAASAAVNKGYQQQVNELDALLKGIKSAYTSGKPLMTPVVDGNGNVQLDSKGRVQMTPVLDNGKPVYYNTASAKFATADKLRQQVQLLVQAANATGDPDNKYAEKLNDLINNADYRNLLTDQGMANIAQDNAGIALEKDYKTGNFKEVNLKQAGLVDIPGLYDHTPTYQIGDVGGGKFVKNMLVAPGASTSDGAGLYQAYQHQINPGKDGLAARLKDKSGFDYIRDPRAGYEFRNTLLSSPQNVDGKKVRFQADTMVRDAQTGQGKPIFTNPAEAKQAIGYLNNGVAPGIGRNRAQQVAYSALHPSVGQDFLDFYGNPARSLDTVGSAVSDVVNTIANPVNAILKKTSLPKTKPILGNINPLGQISKLASFGNQLAQKRAAAEEAARQAEARRRAEEAQIIAQATAAANAARAAQQARATQKVSYDFNTGKVSGLAGAPAIPAPVIKASNTPGTKEFTQKYLPSAIF